MDYEKEIHKLSKRIETLEKSHSEQSYHDKKRNGRAVNGNR